MLVKRNTSYSVNDIVNTTYGIVLKCTTAGTTDTNPLVITGSSTINDGTVVWQVETTGGCTSIGDWATSISYSVGDYVRNNNILYVCNTSHTSSTFSTDKSNWTVITTEQMVGATSSINGASGVVPTPTTTDVNKFLCGDGTWANAGGVNAVKDVLWTGMENAKTPTGTTLSLAHSYTDYDYLLVYVGYNTGTDSQTIKNIGIFDCASPYSNFEYVFTSRVNSTTVTTTYFDISFSGSTWEINKVNTTLTDTYVVKIVGLKFVNSNVYSTTEQRIGTWIDGKPLYQKTITGTTPNTAGSEGVLATISGMETMVSIDGWVRDSSNCFVSMFFTNLGDVSSKDYMYVYTTSTGDICFKTGIGAYANKDFVITVKYTKV